MNLPNASTVTTTVVEAVDAIPVERLNDIDVVDFGDALADASEFIAESAVVLGATSGRVAAGTARAAWRNRSIIATAVVVALAVVGAVALWNRRSDPSADADTS